MFINESVVMFIKERFLNICNFEDFINVYPYLTSSFGSHVPNN
jgi:hypothetical protein